MRSIDYADAVEIDHYKKLYNKALFYITKYVEPVERAEKLCSELEAEDKRFRDEHT